MKILIDADACPVIKEAIKVADAFEIEVIIYCDTSHMIEIDGIETIVVQKGLDAVDFVIANNMKKKDIVITQDYGLAAMVLAKGGYAINQDGFIYQENNIDQLLYRRYLHKVARKSKIKIKGPKKRTSLDNKKFSDSFSVLCEKIIGIKKVP
ncbi:MAG: hypothetical protein BEN19_01165 [Epulopiscium sp. Nuni2H_MBin003]|nr:MAG: hypothetical protein BEN19_01165 [Epulopiscium sp. Nuni2H_MBin003]